MSTNLVHYKGALVYNTNLKTWSEPKHYYSKLNPSESKSFGLHRSYYDQKSLL